MIYEKGLSHSEAQDRGENFSIGAVQMKNSIFSVFLRGFAEGRDSQDVRVSPPSALSSPRRFLGGKIKLELGLCPSPAPARATPGEEKGAWGDFLAFPGAAQEGNSGHGETGRSWGDGRAGRGNSPRRIYAEFIQENLSRRIYPGEFTQENSSRRIHQEEFTQEDGMVHGKGVRAQRSFIDSS